MWDMANIRKPLLRRFDALYLRGKWITNGEHFLLSRASGTETELYGTRIKLYGTETNSYGTKTDIYGTKIYVGTSMGLKCSHI